MDSNIEISRRTLRLPQDVTSFLDRSARQRMTSTNAEIVRILRERMAAATGDSFAGDAPAAARDTSARQGADIHPRS